MLPKWGRDLEVTEAQKEKFPENWRESKFNVAEKDISGTILYESLVSDVRSESINGIKVLTVGSTGTLGWGKEVGAKGDGEKLIIKDLLEDHGTGVSQADAVIAVWIEGVWEARKFLSLYFFITPTFIYRFYISFRFIDS
jgi:hypothetical protein